MQLMPGLERLTQLERDLFACVSEHLQRGLRAASLTDDVLVIAVSSAALSTKLRQLLPRVQRDLATYGWKISAIQLRVQPEDFKLESTAYPRAPKQAVISTQARLELGACAQRLSPSPLRDAIERMAQRS